MTHGHLPEVIDTVRAVHGCIGGILRVNVRVDGHAEVVEAVQGMQDIEAGHVPAVALVPVLREVLGSVGFERFVVGEEEVAVDGELVPGSVDGGCGADVLHAD